MSETSRLGPDREGRLIHVEEGRVSRLEDSGESADELRLEPGRINAHTHIYSGLAPFGMPEPDVAPKNFVEILEKIWWRLDRALDPDTLRSSARYYVAEALLAGTTTLVDHHESPEFIEGSLDVLADACEELGMRALLCFGATERNGGREEGRRGLAECRRFMDSNRRSLVRGVVGLHASFTVSDETIIEAGKLCRELDSLMHVHLAEDLADVEDAKARGFDGPLERLLELEALPPGSILAHGVHCDRGQVELADQAGLRFVQNPRSNRGNGVGYPRALVFHPRVAIGTDGYPSRMQDEEAALRDEAISHGEEKDVVERRLHAGWEMAASLFGSDFAPLAAGSKADIVEYCGGEVSGVLVDGRRVVEKGRLVNADIDEIREDARDQAAVLWKRMRALD